MVIYVLRQETPVFAPVRAEEAGRLASLAITDPDSGYRFEKHGFGPVPKILFEEPVEVFDYAFSTTGSGAFAEDNKLPSGLVYQIQLFVSGSKPSLRQIKGISPVYVHSQRSGKKLCAAGLFRTYAEAERALPAVRKLFPTAFIIAFDNGQPLELSKARKKESSVTVFKPDWSKVTDETFLDALGQAFFSLSLGSGMAITYGSYVSRKENIVSISSKTALADTLFALIAGCAIMPAVFAFGISPGEGPGLVFITLPHIFSQLPVGGFIAILFFIALLLAALTSSISLLEVIVAFCIEEFHIHRRTAVTISLTILWVLGCLCSLSQGVLSGWKLFGKNIFDFFDFVSANVLMLLGGLLVVLFVGWKLGRNIIHDELTNSGKLRIPVWFVDVLTFLVRYLAPAAIITIAVFQWI